MLKKQKTKKSPAKRSPKTKSAGKARKSPKKSLIKKKAQTTVKKEVQIGTAVHYFGKIKVAVVKFKKDVRVGTHVRYRGATTDFADVLSSMQVDPAPMRVAKKGKEVGVKVKKKVRAGDGVFVL